MFINCLCPQAAAIADIPNFSCGENFGQIVKLAFQRRQAAAPFATAAACGTLANWTTLLAATDDTKIQVTPFCENVIIPPVEAITEGGDDNTTLDGTPIVVGATTITVTGQFRSIPGDILVALKSFNCESDITIFAITEFGYIITYSANGTTCAGNSVVEWFIGDGGSNGKNTHDLTMFRWNFRYGWRDKIKIVKPSDFNARDLVNP